MLCFVARNQPPKGLSHGSHYDGMPNGESGEVPSVGRSTHRGGHVQGSPPMVVLRLKRFGRIHSPFYRLSAADKRSPNDGRVIEELGWFSPTAPEGQQWKLKSERALYWLSVGAQPSETVISLLRRAGIANTVGTKGKASLSAVRQKARRNAPKKVAAVAAEKK